MSIYDVKTTKFPYNGTYTAKRSGYDWHFGLNEEGSILYVERCYYDNRGHSKSVTGRISTGLLDYIEKLFGMRTDGWRWQTAEDIQRDEELLKTIPLDGSFRCMRKTVYTTRENGRDRAVYEHVPTGRLYTIWDGRWYGTFESYCYNRKTGERGEHWRPY